ncbi:hypothetical protein QOT17_021449 [Balamuthia mandrillaris]
MEGSSQTNLFEEPTSILKEASRDGILVEVGVLQQEELEQRILEKEDQESRTTTWKVDLCSTKRYNILDPPILHMGIKFNVRLGCMEEFYNDRTRYVQTVTLRPCKPNMEPRRKFAWIRTSSTSSAYGATAEFEDFTEEEKRKIEAWEKHKDSFIKVTITGKDGEVIQQAKGPLKDFEKIIHKENEEDLGEEQWRIYVVTLPPPPAATVGTRVSIKVTHTVPGQRFDHHHGLPRSRTEWGYLPIRPKQTIHPIKTGLASRATEKLETVHTDMQTSSADAVTSSPRRLGGPVKFL